MAKKKKVEKVEKVEQIIPKFRGVPIDKIMDSGDEELIAAFKEQYEVE